jgi:hypothetical protein
MLPKGIKAYIRGYKAAMAFEAALSPGGCFRITIVTRSIHLHQDSGRQAIQVTCLQSSQEPFGCIASSSRASERKSKCSSTHLGASLLVPQENSLCADGPQKGQKKKSGHYVDDWD